jgi:hypothetical protein
MAPVKHSDERLQVESRVAHLEEQLAETKQTIANIYREELKPLYKSMSQMSNRLTISVCLWTINMVLMGFLITQVYTLVERVARLTALIK